MVGLGNAGAGTWRLMASRVRTSAIAVLSGNSAREAYAGEAARAVFGACARWVWALQDLYGITDLATWCPGRSSWGLGNAGAGG